MPGRRTSAMTHVTLDSAPDSRNVFRGFEGDGFVSGGFEDALNRLSNTTIVVDGCDNEIRLRHQPRPSPCRRMVHNRARGWLL